MRISNETYIYDHLTGDVTRENPVPARAKRPAKISKGTKSQLAVEFSGIGRVNWKKVLRCTPAQIEAFQTKHRIGEFTSGNTKTNKDRPTGNPGVIAGLSLSPHYYPNLLNIMHTEEEGLLDFDKRDFNSFDGENQVVASKGSGVPVKELLTFCVGSSPACRMTCLVYAGQNPATKEAPQSKMKLTLALLEDPELFVAGLWAELAGAGLSKKSRDLDSVVRLNMLSDLPWYRLCPELLIELAREPEIPVSRRRRKDGQWPGGRAWPGGRLVYSYDYTKLDFWNDKAYHEMNEKAADEGVISDERHPNGRLVETVLDLTFSYSGANSGECEDALHNGVRVATVFAPLDPERQASVAYRTSWQELLAAEKDDGEPFIEHTDEGPFIDLFDGSWPIVDGDESDYRMDDPSGFDEDGNSLACIVALNFKQPSLTDSAELEAEIQEAEAKRAAQRARGIDVDALDRASLERKRATLRAKGEDPSKAMTAHEALLYKRRSAVPDISNRTRRGRESFAEKVPDPFGSGFQYAQTMGRAPFSEGDYSEFSREDILSAAESEAAVAATAPMPMQRITGTDVLIGPHVPTVLND